MELSNEEIVSRINEYCQALNTNYSTIIHENFPKAFEENREAFKLLDLNECDVFYFQASPPFYFDAYLLIFEGFGNTNLLNTKDISIDTVKLLTGTDELDLLQNYIHYNYDIKSDYIYDDKASLHIIKSHLDEVNKDDWLSSSKNKALLAVQRHARKFIEHIDKPISEYTKDYYKYKFTEIDFTDLINYLKDPDFEFTINESLSCYEKSLYLAATGTAGVALENLCNIILIKKGISIPDEESTEIGYLTNELKRNDIIDRRMKKRIMNAASLRNLASHTNTGRMIREDTKYVYQTILNLASNTFDF